VLFIRGLAQECRADLAILSASSQSPVGQRESAKSRYFADNNNTAHSEMPPGSKFLNARRAKPHTAQIRITDVSTTIRNWSSICSRVHDFDRCVQFCNLIMKMINDDPLFLDNIVFFDEATFELTGNVNRHNCKYWSDINLHWMKENYTQHPQKLMCGVIDFRDRPVVFFS